MKWTAALASSICVLGLGAAVTAYGCSTASNPAQSGDTPNKVIGPQTGPCAPEGLTEPCHAITGQTQGIYNCYAGTQTCSGGTWGTCVAASSTRTILGKPTTPGATGPGLTADLVIPPPSPDAGACASDTCDPYCIGFDQPDAGVLVDAAGISGEISGSYSGLPGGKQQNNNNCHGATNSGGNVATFPGGYTEGCQFNSDDNVQSSLGGSCNDCSMADECCNCTGNGCGPCVPWATATLGVGTCAPPPGCTLPDFTLGVGCLLSNGDVGFPVCNRGNAIANTGTIRLGLNNGNPGGNHSCLNGSCNDNEGFGFCDINLATNPILVQTCIEVDLDNPGPGVTCSGINDNPTESAFINENGTEDIFGVCTPTVAECDYCNNWSAKGPDNTQACAPLQTPPPQSQTFTYQASCPDGSHPFWNQLAFDVNNLGLATVTFSATFQAILPDGGLDVPTASFTLAATPPLPANCPMSGPTPCPVNLDGADGGAGVLPLPAETDEVMNLTVTTQIAGLPPPTIGFWQLSYDCVPTE